MSRPSMTGARAAALAAGLCAAASAPALEQGLIVPDVVAEPFLGDLPEIRNRGILRALVSPSRTDFFLDGARPRGLLVEQAELVRKAMDKKRRKGQLPLEIKYVVLPMAQLIPALLDGRGDVVIANLTVTPERQDQVDFVKDKAGAVDELLVANYQVAAEVTALADLAGRTVQVVNGSSHAEHLREISTRLTDLGLPPIDVQEAHPLLAAEDLLELVNAGVHQFTAADDYRAHLWADVLPAVEVKDEMPISIRRTIGWAVRKGNPKLKAALAKARKQVRRGTLIGNTLLRRYYADTRWIRNPQTAKERERFEDLLGLFQEFGWRYKLDALAIVAQAYQESRLDHRKRSPRGAVGVMQMLPSTAADPNVGIRDISKLEDNIHAGARYMAFLRDRYFSDPAISEADRKAFTLAAYNAGPARVARMRKRTKAMNLDPNRWFGHTEYGALAVVGRETVRYVRNVFKYYLTYKTMVALESGRRDAVRASGPREGAIP